jgi:ribosomal protein L13E
VQARKLEALEEEAVEQKNLDRARKQAKENHSCMIKAEPRVFKKGKKQRRGKGFSGEELKKAGLSFKEALKLGIPVDPKRRTSHEENVEAIKTFLENMKAKTGNKGKSKS